MDVTLTVLGVLLGLVVLAIPVAVLYLMVNQGRLRVRLEDLEREIARLRPDGPIEQPKTAAIPAPEGPWLAARQADPKRAAAKSEDTPPDRSAAPAARHVPPERRPSPVFDALVRFVPWLRDNWFYAISALSLALAGIFLVQYGVENGLLPPRARVAAALGFGAVLIGAGEWIRRRFGDDEDSATAYLPSVFSGAGIVALFGAVLSARLLYDLIGPQTALVGMVAVALVALVLGWFHGPLLAAVGIIGAYVAPFVVGGSSKDPSWLFGYFALIAALGLGVDTVRRWAWISALTLVLAFAAGWLLAVGGIDLAWAFALYATVLVLMGIAIPARSLWPDHAGAMFSEMLVLRGRGERPIFPVLLALAALIASCAILFLTAQNDEAEFWLAVVCLTGLAGLLTIWSAKGPALQDLAALPAATLLGAVYLQGEQGRLVYATGGAAARRFLQADVGQEAGFPMQVTVLVAVGVALTLVAAWRAMRNSDHGAVWAGAAAVLAPAMAILIEVSWTPARVIGAYPWALHAAMLAALMVVLAERFARRDGEDRLRVALFALSALSCVAFGFVIIFSSAALTVALAVTVVAAAFLDRQFNLRPMGLFIAAGVATLGYRLVADPGLVWGRTAPLAEMVLAYGGTFIALISGLWALRGKDRPMSRLMLDSAAWSSGGILVSLLIWRWIEAASGDAGTASHWAMGLFATIWFGMALAQVQREEIGRLVWLRRALGGVFGLMGLGALAFGVTLFSPILDGWFGSLVLGPPVVNTLAVGYLLPALVLAVGAWRIRAMPVVLRWCCQGVAVALNALWAALAIRHFWQGKFHMPLHNGVSQPELYTYTIALLLVGAGLFYQSLARGHVFMRRAGLVVIGLAVAKVFFVDIAGLGGLTRVFSLLALGLSLAGLAWLNRWAQGRRVAQ